jgi:hypothetical protein
MRRKFIASLLLAFCLVLALVGAASAKNLLQRISVGAYGQVSYDLLGVDFDNPFLNQQGLSVKYWFTDRIGLEGLVAFAYAKVETERALGGFIEGKFHGNVVMEENMNMFVGGGLGLAPLSLRFKEDGDTDADSHLGFLLQAFAGFEFFLPGLPNLGLDVEFGLQYLDLGQAMQFGNYGGLGVRYYF